MKISSRAWSIAVLLLLLPRAGKSTEATEVQASAFAGRPLGVAKVHFQVADPAEIAPGGERFNIAGEHQRVLYPVFLPDPAPGGPAGPAGAPRGFQALFLFPGNEPVTFIATTNLSMSPYREFRARLAPAPETSSPAEARSSMVREWWSAYRQLLEGTRRRDEVYPVIEGYLAWHLPRLFGLPAEPLDVAPRTARPLGLFPEADHLVDLFLGTESIRIALQRDALLEKSGADDAAPSVPLPEAPAIPPVDLPPAGQVAIEPIARCIPGEVLYIRFPSFTDFRVLRDRAEEWSGGLNDLILARSLDAGVKELLETQLALRETALGRLFGDLAIGEMAIAAYDTFVREGSALGFVFEVRNEALFDAALSKLRDEAITASRTRPEGPAREEKLEIGGRPVAFLSAPGNRIRSFHASAGKFHLVTNCRRLVERFLSCASGGPGSLADDPGFRHARDLHPISAPQSALVYISDPFIRGLIGPAYRAEMTRRIRSRAGMETAEIAARAAQAETGRVLDLPALEGSGWLSARTIRQPDGSKLQSTPAGLCDSLRGCRGTFLPIPDVGVERLTPAEARAYQEFSRFYRGQWERVDPVAIRFLLAGSGAAAGKPPEGGGERLTVAIDILPFAREPYQVLRAALGQPSPRTLAPVPHEIASLEGELSPMLLRSAVWVRGGILDFERPLVLEGGAGIRPLGDPTQLPAYAILPITDRYPDGTIQVAVYLSGKPAADGLLAIDGGLLGVPLWGKVIGERAVVSTRREVLEAFGGEIRLGETERPAQARLRIDLTAARAALPALRAAAHDRARSAAASGAALLSSIHGTLKVPLADCEAEAERILGARLAAPTGGRFLPGAYPMGGGMFFSSEAFAAEGKLEKSPAELARLAAAFRHPLLDRLAGLAISFTLGGRTLHSEAVISWKGMPDARPGTQAAEPRTPPAGGR
jgi:hypothetical protein